MNIWTHWEGPKIPYIELCIDSIRRMSYSSCLFHNVNEQNIDSYIPEGTLHPSWKSIGRLGIKSDCIRAAVLHLYGGLYIDADTVMLRSPAGMIDESKDCVYMTWSTPPDRVIAGYIYCKPGSLVAKRWLEYVNRALENGRTGWCQLGEGCLTPAVRSVEDTQQISLKTFLPIEIDTKVQEFFKNRPWRSYTTDETIAFGLNHSWMTRKFPKEMATLPHKMGNGTLIQRLLYDAHHVHHEPKVGVCCCTYRRPELLSRLIDTFEKQDYQNREMIILDDSGELEPATGKSWMLVCHTERYPSLGAKRNKVIAMTNADIIVNWDDDDLAMPWALSAIASGMRRADWVRPSTSLVRHDSLYVPVRTYSLPDRSDKAYHPTWGYSRALFNASGGYPDDVSLGEDLILARRFRDLKPSEADPVAMGFDPYYVFGPWDNEHFSFECKDYVTWKDRTKPSPGSVQAIETPLLNIAKDREIPRPFQNNWWEDATR